MTLPGNCTRIVAGADPYCYEMRDGYADIGDPPLVGAYRNLANVVLRFNLRDRLRGRRDGPVAAAGTVRTGVVGRRTKQSLGGRRHRPGGGVLGKLTALVNGLAPVVSIAGGFADRSQLRHFLVVNYPIVDEALVLMARDSVDLYANVAVGTNLFRRLGAPGTDQSLLIRRREIRRLISNWTVLIDDTRRLLGELRLALETSDGLETRLVNLEGTVKARIDTSAIKKQIATLGTPVLGP